MVMLSPRRPNLLWWGQIQGDRVLSRSGKLLGGKHLGHKLLARTAVIGALIAAVGVSGCGLKAGLDPPPSAAAVAEPELGPDGKPVERYKPLGADGKPVAPKTGEKRWTPLDFLLE
jgi:hypothetical protein